MYSHFVSVRDSKGSRFIFALLITCALASSHTVRGQHNPWGKVTGRVVAIETQRPLAYANVILVGTNLGAMTLADGRFTISNVPPGKYTVKAMMMGYKPLETKIVVLADSNVVAVFKLEVTIVDRTQTITVTGQKAMIDVRSSQLSASIRGQQLNQMPIDDVLEAVALKAGVVKRGDEMFVRGGRLLNRYRNDFRTESYERIYENEFLGSIDNPFSTFSIDVDAASYSNVRRFIRGHRLPPPGAVRIEELINYFEYDYPQPKNSIPFTITTEVSRCPWNEKNRLVHIGLQGKRVDAKDLPPSNLVFLLDVSGSMKPKNKLPLVKQSFKILAKNLRKQDRVAIVVYAGAAGCVLPSTSGDKQARILTALRRLHAGGSTAGAQGINLAYQIAEENFIKDGNNRVILATDGDFNIGVTNNSDLVRLIEKKRDTGIFLTILGFGMDNLKDARLQQLADKGNGHHAYIDNIREARKVFGEELSATLLTIAKDVKIQVEWNPARVEEYRLIGYENRMLKKEDFDNDKKDAGEMGAGHSVTALYEVVLTNGKMPSEADSDLSYITTSVKNSAYETKELLTVRFRYKLPNEDTSQLIVRKLEDRDRSFDKASENFRFSAAVAQFGMLLRDSEFKGDATWETALDAARGAKGRDKHGYRAEFVQLVESCQMMADQ